MQQNMETMLMNFQHHVTSALADVHTHVNEVQSHVAKLEAKMSASQESIDEMPNIFYTLEQKRERAKEEEQAAATQATLADVNFRMELESEAKQEQLSAISDLSKRIENVQRVLDDVQHATMRAEIRVRDVYYSLVPNKRLLLKIILF